MPGEIKRRSVANNRSHIAIHLHAPHMARIGIAAFPTQYHVRFSVRIDHSTRIKKPRNIPKTGHTFVDHSRVKRAGKGTCRAVADYNADVRAVVTPV